MIKHVGVADVELEGVMMRTMQMFLALTMVAACGGAGGPVLHPKDAAQDSSLSGSGGSPVGTGGAVVGAGGSVGTGGASSTGGGVGSGGGSGGAATGGTTGRGGTGGGVTSDAPVSGGSGGGLGLDAAAGSGGSAGGTAGSGGTGGAGGGSGGTTRTGGTGGSSTCPMVPPCNWCGGTSIYDGNGCVIGWRCANGANPCTTSACGTSNPCEAGYTCGADLLCWAEGAGGAGGVGTGGNYGTGGAAATGGKPGAGGTLGTGGSTGAPGCEYECRTVGGVTGWYLLNELVCEADCLGCTVSCNHVGSRSEGCWSMCGGIETGDCLETSYQDNGLINYMFCSDPYAAAYLAWQSPDAVERTGPAVAVSATGAWMRVWSSVERFEPESPPAKAESTYELDRLQLNDLFSRLAAVDVASLPHDPVAGLERCRPTLYFRLCAGCAPKTLSYPAPESVSPELESVWSWFDQLETIGPGPVVNPRYFCASGS